jgi:hypothetical protein
LRGEAPDASTQAAKSTTSASGSAAGSAAGPAFSGAICGPLVPSTDGGSVNVTELAGGGSLNGCQSCRHNRQRCVRMLQPRAAR